WGGRSCRLPAPQALSLRDWQTARPSAPQVKKMASSKQKIMLSAGDRAPDFELEDLSGERRTLSGLSGGKPVLLAFFKVSCPVCQYAFPFLERMYRGRSN